VATNRSSRKSPMARATWLPQDTGEIGSESVSHIPSRPFKGRDVRRTERVMRETWVEPRDYVNTY
jgi:hypothetical protein